MDEAGPEEQIGVGEALLDRVADAAAVVARQLDAAARIERRIDTEAASERRGEVEVAPVDAELSGTGESGTALGEQGTEERRISLARSQGAELGANAGEQGGERVLAFAANGAGGIEAGERARSLGVRARRRLRRRRQLRRQRARLAARPLDDRRRLERRLAVGARTLGGGVGLDHAKEIGERHVRAARSSSRRPRSRG